MSREEMGEPPTGYNWIKRACWRFGWRIGYRFGDKRVKSER